MDENDKEYPEMTQSALIAAGYDPDQVAGLFFHAEVMVQLRDSQTFNRFFETYYTLAKSVDDESKTIDYNLIEKPTQMVQEEMMKEYNEKMAEKQGSVSLATPEEIDILNKH